MNVVPLLDLGAQHAPLRKRLMRSIGQVFDSGCFAGGPAVEAFEADFSAYCGTSHAVGVASGTDALWLALEALGIGPGDEVVTVAMTFAATVEAILRTGARPVLVDIDDRTYTMDVEQLEESISPRTKAILPVHLFGQMADMDAILRLAGERGIPVVEDAAQAHGAMSNGHQAGSLGAAGCFSFYPGKNLGALGDAGAVVTSDGPLAQRMRVLRDHGQSRKYHHEVLGWNSRMDGIQGAILQVKLRDLARNNRRRKEHADRYLLELADFPGLVLPQTVPGRTHAWHLFVLRVPDRGRFVRELAERGISTGIHYPIPIHFQKAFAGWVREPGAHPVAERCASEFVSLPMFPEMTESQIDRVVSAVRQAARAEGSGSSRTATAATAGPKLVA